MGSFSQTTHLCVKLFRTEKRNFYKNLDISQIIYNKKFWNTAKPFISNKNKAKVKITLIEDDRIISKDEEVAETLNNYCWECASVSLWGGGGAARGQFGKCTCLTAV